MCGYLNRLNSATLPSIVVAGCYPKQVHCVETKVFENNTRNSKPNRKFTQNLTRLLLPLRHGLASIEKIHIKTRILMEGGGLIDPHQLYSLDLRVNQLPAQVWIISRTNPKDREL